MSRADCVLDRYVMRYAKSGLDVTVVRMQMVDTSRYPQAFPHPVKPRYAREGV